jgi:hypothetical protein
MDFEKPKNVNFNSLIVNYSAVNNIKGIWEANKFNINSKLFNC